MSELKFNTVSFLSDYGLSDEFVGITRSVIRTIAPDVAVIDITHDIDAHDVRAGGLALARSVQYLAPGIVLGVVDPGVGTDRKRIAIEVGDGQAYPVGPDNGLFAPAVSMIGGASRAIVLDNPEYHLAGPGSTFDGRDVFAPVAAHLCLGVRFEDLGTMIDPAKLLPGILPVSQTDDDGSIACEVLWIDRFGNVQLNVDPDDLSGWSDHIELKGDHVTRTAARVENFSEVPTGACGLMVDSYGLLTIVADRSPAAQDMQLVEGDRVHLRPADGPRYRPTPVSLLPKPTTTPPDLPVGEHP